MIVEIGFEIDAFLENTKANQGVLGCDEVGQLGDEVFIGHPTFGRGQDMLDDLTIASTSTGE